MCHIGIDTEHISPTHGRHAPTKIVFLAITTAKRFSKGLGYTINRETLRDPVKNVAIGSRFLSFLWSAYGGNPGFVVPAYNAGEGAVWRWLCERGTWDHDEFAEAIPFDETRSYAKRVLASYFTYAYLARGEIPTVPLDIPASAINKRICR